MLPCKICSREEWTSNDVHMKTRCSRKERILINVQQGMNNNQCSVRNEQQQMYARKCTSINVPMEQKQQLITCPMNINRWTQRERNSKDVHLKNGPPPTFPWTWNLTKVRVKKEQQVFTGKNKHPPYPRGGWTSMDVRKKETTSTQRCMQSDHKKRSPEGGPQRVSTKEWKNIQQPITLRKKPAPMFPQEMSTPEKPPEEITSTDVQQGNEPQ